MWYVFVMSTVGLTSCYFLARGAIEVASAGLLAGLFVCLIGDASS